MEACGETNIIVTRGSLSLQLQAVVVKDLDCDILAGVPFMKLNNIVLDLPGEAIVISNKRISYSSPQPDLHSANIRRSQSFLLRPTRKEVILPGEYIELKTPTTLDDETVAIEPRYDSCEDVWIKPTLTKAVDGFIRIPNLTSSPVSVSKHQHLIQVYHTTTPEELDTSPTDLDAAHMAPKHPKSTRRYSISSAEAHSSLIVVDPDKQLTTSEKQAFINMHKRYDNVFNGNIGCYNDASGHVRAYINMGPVEPPVHKARLPSYNSDKMHLLQKKMDELEELGVLARPEDVDVTVEHVSPSFLIKKPDGSHRLVTAFTTIGTYAKPIISQPTSTDDVLRFLAKYKYIIKSDMTKQFFQLPMRKNSMKYLGVLTPYKGLRVYTRAAMGMPGSTEHLDELMSRVLGDLMEKGIVKKIADDLYTGGNTVAELTHNWEQILHAFEQNNLRLSASKTVICPITTTILGWIWSAGQIKPSTHKVTPLATASPPSTIKGLRSWIGAFKHLKLCIPNYSDLLSTLETATGGKESRSNVEWTDNLLTSFHRAQKSLSDVQHVTIPRPGDKLVITTDGAVSDIGIGSVLYISRDGNMHVGGYFSAKLKPHQRKWLPCEIEALAISASITHWSPYIVQSDQVTQVLTDSRPCVQAYAKMSRGRFSTSARISTFLSVLSRYSVSLQYIPGDSNLPADYQSRHPVLCNEKNCQICTFLNECETSTVFKLTVTEVMDGKCSMPFTSPIAWKAAQHDCPSLRRTYAHLSQGTRPTKKDTHVREVKRYLQSCTIGKNSLIIQRKILPFCPTRELTAIPQHLLSGLLTALHIRLQHPTRNQMKQMFNKFFFALDSDKEIEQVCANCSQCASLATLPKDIEKFTTTDQLPSLGTSFACDIMRRARQYIFLIRDTFSSYTVTKLIPDEKSATLKSVLIETTAELKAQTGCIIRVDAATTFQSLCKDPHFNKLGITLEMGRTKNRNKNPVAEKAIQELEHELRRSYPEGDPVTQDQLAIVTATLNMRVRNRGLSAREIVFQRDPHTGEQLQISDNELAAEQHLTRIKNHQTSAISQSSSNKLAKQAHVQIGSLIYIKSEGNKHQAREIYIVADTKPEYLVAQKLTQSQIRAKRYRLKYDEVYVVPDSKQDVQYDMEYRDSEQTELGNKPMSTQEIFADSDSDCSDFEIVPTPLTQNIQIQNPVLPPRADESSSGTSESSDDDVQNEDNQPANSDTDDIQQEEIPPRPPDPIQPPQATVRRNPQRARKPPEHLDEFELNLDTLFKE